MPCGLWSLVWLSYMWHGFFGFDLIWFGLINFFGQQTFTKTE